MNTMEQSTGYVVYYVTFLQDGHEEGSKVFAKLDEALKYIDWLGNTGGDRTEFRLFELGKEIPLNVETVEEPQPSKKKVRYQV